MEIQNIFNINWDKKEVREIDGIFFNIFESEDFGEIRITYETYANEYEYFSEDYYYKFQSILRHNYLLKKEILICSTYEKPILSNKNSQNKIIITLSELISEFPKNITESQRLALINLSKINPNYGQPIQKVSKYDLYAKNSYEAIFILNILKEKNQISFKFKFTFSHSDTFNITEGILIKESGWIEIEKLETPSLSKQVFVAIWFDAKMTQAYQEIENACRKNGFSPIRIDNKEHNNEISSEIIFEIRKSKFLIAEVTGQRHGVYFEAGYAMGFGLPVIWCCNKTDLKDVHFDTRQYNHVVWETEQELFDKLEKRIRSTIN